MDISRIYLINKPKSYEITQEKISIITNPFTDFWQRTYYDFRNDNAPSLLFKTAQKYFTFSTKTQFESKEKFDQCGIIMYLDSENWVKASIEYENKDYARLGSVVTNNGYSDWATTDVCGDTNTMYYRLSRREADFCIENSIDGKIFKQMRIFHMFNVPKDNEISIGFYACSPKDSSFEAQFTEFKMQDCIWEKES